MKSCVQHFDVTTGRYALQSNADLAYAALSRQNKAHHHRQGPPVRCRTQGKGAPEEPRLQLHTLHVPYK